MWISEIRDLIVPCYYFLFLLLCGCRGSGSGSWCRRLQTELQRIMLCDDEAIPPCLRTIKSIPPLDLLHFSLPNTIEVRDSDCSFIAYALVFRR